MCECTNKKQMKIGNKYYETCRNPKCSEYGIQVEHNMPRPKNPKWYQKMLKTR